jgi:hypothetical protein
MFLDLCSGLRELNACTGFNLIFAASHSLSLYSSCSHTVPHYLRAPLFSHYIYTLLPSFPICSNLFSIFGHEYVSASHITSSQVLPLLLQLCYVHTPQPNLILKNSIFYDVAPCVNCKTRRFGGNCRFHLQGRKIRDR